MSMAAQALRRLERRVGSILLRAMVTAVDDSGAVQRYQLGVRADEVKDGVELVLPQGLAVRPVPATDPDGSGPTVLLLAPDSDLRFALLGADTRYRLRGDALQVGDTALHTDLDDPEAEAGAAVHRVQLTRDGTVPVVVTRTVSGTVETTVTQRGDGSITVEATDGADTSTFTITPGQITLSTPSFQIYTDSMDIDPLP